MADPVQFTFVSHPECFQTDHGIFKDRTAVFVMTSGRSGSSCLCGMLSYLGIPMTLSEFDCQIPEKDDKESMGAYLECRIFGLFSDMLAAKVLHPLGMVNYIHRRGFQAKVWGVKCGSSPGVIRLWKDAMPGNIIVLRSKRGKEDQAKSKEKYWKEEYDKVLESTEGYEELVDGALAHCGLDSHDFWFEDVIGDPEGTVKRLLEIIPIEPTEEQIQAAINWVDPKLTACITSC